MAAGYQIAIETSASRGSVALGRETEMLFEEEFELGRRPSEVLMEPLQKVGRLREAVGDVWVGARTRTR